MEKKRLSKREEAFFALCAGEFLRANVPRAGVASGVWCRMRAWARDPLRAVRRAMPLSPVRRFSWGDLRAGREILDFPNS
jgi:hypothetical protein